MRHLTTVVITLIVLVSLIVGLTMHASAQQTPLSPMMESKYGMKVIEINTIHDALIYFNST